MAPNSRFGAIRKGWGYERPEEKVVPESRTLEEQYFGRKGIGGASEKPPFPEPGSLKEFWDQQHPRAATPETRGVIAELVDSAVEESGYRPWGQELPQVDDALELRWRTGDWKIIYRPFLVSVDGTGDTHVSLFCTSCSFVIGGRHLGELRRLIKARQIDFIEEFDPNRWPTRRHGEPVVERIQRLGLDGKEQG